MCTYTWLPCEITVYALSLHQYTILFSLFFQAPLSLCGVRFNCRCEDGCYRLEKMKSVPDKYPEIMDTYDVTTGSRYGFLVLGNRDIYVVGGKHNTPKHWPCDDNFFKYDMKQNSWVTLPSMDTQHQPLLIESDGYIYSVGKEHSEVVEEEEEWYGIQKYSMAEKKWQHISCEIGDTAVVGCVFIHQCLLILTHDASDSVDPGIYKFKLYNTATDKWSKVCWKKTPNAKQTREGPMIFMYKDNVYVIRYFKVKNSKPRIMKAHIFRLECNFESKKPSVTEAEEIDCKEAFGVEANEIGKLNPRINFTFDKRKLGMAKRKVTNCVCHRDDQMRHELLGY